MDASVAVVTGAGTGIGRAIALRLAGEGMELALCGRRLQPLEELAEEVRPLGRRVLLHSCDVSDATQVNEFFARVKEEFHQLRVLVNNAGISGWTPAHPPQDETWERIIAINLSGAYYCSSRAVPLLQEGGRIVNISSILGRFGVPGYAAYCASKHGLLGLTRVFALELAPRRITVNAVCPGWVETEMARQGMQKGASQAGISYEDYRKLALRRVPLGEIIQPEEVAGLVAYLVSPEAANLTGQTINLCGGQVMS